MATSNQTHTAVVTVAARAPLETREVPTIQPSGKQVLIHNLFTASTPLDLHQADGGLLVTHPQVLGDGVAGRVLAVGSHVTRLSPGDLVFGFTWRNQAEKAHQTHVTAPENLLAKLPAGFELQEAVTLGNNFVSAWHALVEDLGFELPWPKAEGWVPQGGKGEEAVLIWGGSSSVGMYAVQILKWYGYRNLITTASERHHGMLKGFGARVCFDYNDKGVVEEIRKAVPRIPRILDCIGSQAGSLAPLAKIAEKGVKVAVLLPVIVRDATEDEAPEYLMDVAQSAEWAEGVETAGVRTHFYLENEFHAEHLQPTIMPEMLRMGAVKPNKQRIVEGATLLERAQKALDMLRRKEASGERLVWKVADEGDE